MREIYATIAQRLRDDRPIAVATLVAMKEAAPAPIGTSLLVDDDGSFLGNIGAGCHEGEIIEAAVAMLGGTGERTLVVDLQDEAFDGSACGASLTVVVWTPDVTFAPVAERIARGEEQVAFACGSFEVCIGATRCLIVVGATDLGASLTSAARRADFHVTVVDPRPVFATPLRQPLANRIVVGWPEDVLPALIVAGSAVVVLSHDAKIDIPALRCALDSQAAYVGALGSRRAQRVRRERLAQLGYSKEALARLHGPAGLDLGASTPGQTACSILAEVLAVLNDRTATSLRATQSAIH